MTLRHLANKYSAYADTLRELEAMVTKPYDYEVLIEDCHNQMAWIEEQGMKERGVSIRAIVDYWEAKP